MEGEERHECKTREQQLLHITHKVVIQVKLNRGQQRENKITLKEWN